MLTVCSGKPSQKNNIEPHENLLALMKRAWRYGINFKIQYQKVER